MTSLIDEQQTELLNTLQKRFQSNMHRHQHIDWSSVASKLMSHTDKLWSLLQMEATEGEPDVILKAPDAGIFTFIDCSNDTASSIVKHRVGLHY
ncbi:MAG: DUF4256 domain-containing protein [Bacilli bacterium]